MRLSVNSRSPHLLKEMCMFRIGQMVVKNLSEIKFFVSILRSHSGQRTAGPFPDHDMRDCIIEYFHLIKFDITAIN